MHMQTLRPGVLTFFLFVMLDTVHMSAAWAPYAVGLDSGGAVHFSRRSRSWSLFQTKSARTCGRNGGFSIRCAGKEVDSSDKFQYVADNAADVLSLPTEPDPNLKPEDVVLGLVRGLQHNDVPEKDSGLRRCFFFSNDMCKAAVGGDGEGRAGGVSVENFIKYAKNPTFQSMVGCTGFKRQPLGFVPGTETRGAMATQVVTIMRDGLEDRNFLWTLQQERRPPLAGCWLVRQCLFMENAITQTL